MATLENVLQKSEYAQLSSEEARSALLANVDVPNPSVLYTMSGVGKAFTEANVSQEILFDVVGFIESLVGGKSLSAFLMSPGKCDFTETGIQQQLAANAQIEAANPTRLAAVNVLIGLGAPVSTPQWQIEEIQAEPTLEQISAAMSKNAVKQQVAHAINEIMHPMAEAGHSWSEIQAAIAGS